MYAAFGKRNHSFSLITLGLLRICVHVTNNNNGHTLIFFIGKMFSWRGVDTATGHVVVNTKYRVAFKLFGLMQLR